MNNKKFSLNANTYFNFTLQILLILFIYFVCRLVFFFYNQDSLAIESGANFLNILLGGLRFDLSAIAYTNLLFAVILLFPLSEKFLPKQRRLAKWAYLLVNIVAIILNLGDVIYSRFTGRRTTTSVFTEFGNENPLNFLGFFWDYWHITLIGIILIFGLIYSYRRIDELKLFKAQSLSMGRSSYYFSKTCLLILVIYLSIGAMRGSFGDDRPMRPVAALAYTSANPRQGLMVLNTPFVMIRLLSNESFPIYHYMSKEEANNIFNPVTKEQKRSPLFAKFKGRNLVLIIWESCAKEWVGKLNQDVEGYKGYTPFLDSLMSKSFYFERAFSNGGVSVDALPALIASVPKPNESYIATPYATNKINSLAEYLNEADYETAFFHNAPTGSMHFDAMARNLSYKRYYGMEDFGDDSQYDGRWGIWDEPFLQYMSQELSKLKEPFFATEFTASSHHPFDVPKEYEKRFPPTPESGFHRVIPYSDYALSRFFESAKKEPWYENSLFVIVADHSITPHLKEYQNSIGAFSIPFVFFDPRGELVGSDSETVVSQLDFFPTMLDLMGLDRGLVRFGSNMFNPDETHFAYNSLGSSYQLIQGDYVLQFDGEKVFSLFNYKQDRYLKNNLKGQGLEIEGKLQKLIQVFLQELSERLHNDKLSLKD